MAQQTMPEFREPDVQTLSIGDEFAWTHESNRCGTDFVSKSGVVVEVFDNRVQVNVGSSENSNFYEISKTGKVTSLSENFNRSMVGYCVYK